MSRAARPFAVAATCALALALGTGATPGDVGGCGARASDLDVALFAKQRKDVDCARCRDCGLSTARCGRACDAAAASDVALPATCHPLAHDGDVCIRALRVASCDDYASYVDDDAPSSPTECDFCHVVTEAGP